MESVQLRVLRILMACVPPLLIVVYASQLAFPASVTDGATVTVNKFIAPMREADAGLSLVALVTTVLATRARLRFAWLPLAVALGFPMVAVASLFRGSAPLVPQGSMLQAEGQTYCLFSSRFNQGNGTVLGCLTTSTQFQDQFDIVTTGSGQAMQGCLAIVRPASADPNQTLWLSPGRILVALDTKNLASMAIDLSTGQVYNNSGSHEGGRVRKMHDLSPFVLLGPTAVPRAEDVAILLNPNDVRKPRLAAIQADLDSPNSEVREIAQRLIPEITHDDHP